MPPISAWLELDGSAKYQVARFQAIAPTSPARTTFSAIPCGSTTPLATVVATFSERNAPAKLRRAEPSTASRGEIARVETLVAIAFAASWKPFVKSKKSATATTATSVKFIASSSGVLDDDVSDRVRDRLAGIDRALERLEDVLPANHLPRAHLLVLEERRHGVADDPVAVVLEPLHLSDGLARAAKVAQHAERPLQLRGRLDQNPALIERLLHRRLNPVEVEQIRGLLDVVDDVVDGLRQVIDVLAVEGRHVLGVEELEDIGGQTVALVLELLDARMRHRDVWRLAEADLGQASRLMRGSSGGGKQVVELCRAGNER